MPTTKSEWRAWAAQQIDGVDHQKASRAIVDVLDDLLDKDAPTLTFLPMPKEVDLRALDHRNLYTTRTPKDGPLTVHHYEAEREVHPWGYEQPSKLAIAVDPTVLAVALVPGVVFGRDGSRIGHGKGYYDRLLSSCPGIQKIGVAFGALVVDTLPRQQHDVSMDGLVTEAGYVKVR